MMHTKEMEECCANAVKTSIQESVLLQRCHGNVCWQGICALASLEPPQPITNSICVVPNKPLPHKQPFPLRTSNVNSNQGTTQNGFQWNIINDTLRVLRIHHGATSLTTHKRPTCQSLIESHCVLLSGCAGSTVYYIL